MRCAVIVQAGALNHRLQAPALGPISPARCFESGLWHALCCAHQHHSRTFEERGIGLWHALRCTQ
eukprot:1160820-Pelagomonas_calceolata.AAC.1